MGGGIQVLFDPEGVHRDSPQGESAAKGASTGSIPCTAETGGVLSEHGAACIGNGQADQLYMKKVAGALNCMHDPQSVIIKNGGVKICQYQDKIGALSDYWKGINSQYVGQNKLVVEKHE